MTVSRRPFECASVIPAFAAAASFAVLLAAGMSTAPVQAESASAAGNPRAVSALGRIEPEHGVITLSAASIPEAIFGALLERLLVEAGDEVEAGQLLAVTDTAPVLQAKVDEIQAQITVAQQQVEAARSSARAICVKAGVAQREAERLVRLRAQNLASEDEIDRARGNADAGAADCTSAEADTAVAASRIELEKAHKHRAQLELERAFVRAPSAGKVLTIHTRPGEQIDPVGILDIGRVERMYAIAEVYETDIGYLRIGQAALISSPALPEALTGRIEHIRPLVRKLDQIGSDPATRKDARIVEVEVLLDSPALVAERTYLQVEIVFKP